MGDGTVIWGTANRDGSCSRTSAGTIPDNVYWALTKHACETLTCHADPLRGQRLAALMDAVLQEILPPLSAVPWKQPACPSPSMEVGYEGETWWTFFVARCGDMHQCSNNNKKRDKQPEPRLDISLRFSAHQPRKPTSDNSLLWLLTTLPNAPWAV